MAFNLPQKLCLFKSSGYTLAQIHITFNIFIVKICQLRKCYYLLFTDGKWNTETLTNLFSVIKGSRSRAEDFVLAPLK